MPTKIDWARLAAFIDGEGSITAQCQIRDRGVKREHVTVVVSIANTDPRLILWLRRTFGGGGTRTYKAPHSDSIVYRWNACGKKSEWILLECLPYFIFKREQAEIALAIRATTNLGFNGRYSPLPEYVTEHRRELKEKLESLRVPPTLEEAERVM